MKELERIILEQGQVMPGDVLKIDKFLNHQIDVKVADMIGEEFYKLFKDTKPNKILTIEASGIAIACATSRSFSYLPVLYAKKTAASNMSKDVYLAKEHSYTRDIDYSVAVSKEYLGPNDKILIVDDFLANGEAICSLLNICKQAQSQVVGVGAVVCKTYQPGKKRILDQGYLLKNLVEVKAMNDAGEIFFED